MIGLNWYEGVNNGGTVVIDYRVWYQLGTGTGQYSILTAGLTTTSFNTTASLTMGEKYTFIVQARNAFGFGANSTATTILAAYRPSPPALPSTTFAPDTVTIKWDTPVTNGAIVTAYVIKIRHSDGGTFTENIANCNGTIASIVTATSCTIPVATLRADPYLLPYGSSIFAKVIAINEKGASTES